jgi:hypothetical protein
MIGLSWCGQAAAQNEFFEDLENAYMAVFVHVVRSCDSDDRVFSIAVAVREDGNPVPMPEDFSRRLRQTLEKKGVDFSGYVPASEVDWNEKEMHYAHKVLKKQVWVYSVLKLSWHGDNRLYVSQCKANGLLAGGGSTLILEQRRDKWVVVDEVQKWTASHEPLRIQRLDLFRLRDTPD